MCLATEETQRGIRSSATGVTDSCESPCECWELNLGPLQEQVVFVVVCLFETDFSAWPWLPWSSLCRPSWF